MSVESRTPGGARATPAAPSRPPFYLRLPDVSAAQSAGQLQAEAPRHGVHPAAHDAVAAARAKLSERRFDEGRQQMARMIDGLRNRRQRLFRGLWSASILLTALSIVALAVELLQRMDIFNSVGDAAYTENPQSNEPARRRRETSPAKKLAEKAGAPREWSNQLPDDSVRSAVYETTEARDRSGAWLPGTITDNDSDKPRRGNPHDDHQSRAE